MGTLGTMRMHAYVRFSELSYAFMRIGPCGDLHQCSTRESGI